MEVVYNIDMGKEKQQFSCVHFTKRKGRKKKNTLVCQVNFHLKMSVKSSYEIRRNEWQLGGDLGVIFRDFLHAKWWYFSSSRVEKTQLVNDSL